MKQKKKKKLQIINLSELEEKLAKFLKSGVAKKTSSGIELNLQGYKLLGNLTGKLKNKLIIKVSSTSASAKAEVEKTGGKVELVK
jgi:ribosomal protein L15